MSLVAQSSDEPVTLSEISQATGIDKATTLRLLATLEAWQLVQRDPVTRRYAGGVGLWRMLTSWRSDLRDVSRPHLESLRRFTEETVTLVCPRGLERVVVESLAAPRELCVVPSIGSAEPIYAGASGKVIMAYMPEEDRDRVIELTNLKPVRSEAFTDPATFLEELSQVRQCGYAYAIGTVTAGVSALAAPIFEPTGRVAGCVSLRAPESRLPRQRIEQLAPYVVNTGRGISEQLGYRGGEATTRAAG